MWYLWVMMSRVQVGEPKNKASHNQQIHPHPEHFNDIAFAQNVHSSRKRKAKQIVQKK